MKKSTNSNSFVINVIIRIANEDRDLNTEEYTKLFEEFVEAEISGKSSLEKECIIMTKGKHQINQNNFFHGQFVEYTNIDRRKWFNLIKKDRDTEFTIPDYLKANSKINHYYFIPKIHRFCYNYTAKEKIDPAHVENYFNSSLKKFFNANYNGRYYPEIHFEKEKETIQQIMEADEILKLNISVSYSNNFDKEMLDFFDNDMKNGNYDFVEINAQNKNKESLKIKNSKILSGAIQASISQGDVTARIKKDNKYKIINTADHPAKHKLGFSFAIENAKDIVQYFINVFL